MATDELVGSAFAFMRFQLAQAERRVAYAEYNAASLRVENCQIKERNAEIESQSLESLALGKKLGTLTDRERSIGLDFARYVVTGRT